MSFEIHDRFISQARAIERMLQDRVDAAILYVNDKLGFNGWSRQLHDHEQIFGFLLPPEVYSNQRLTRNLWKFISNVFYAHLLSVEESYLMPDSSNPSISEIMGDDVFDRYEVDWCGSRSRRVELGPHIFFRVVFNGWIGRVREDPEPPQMPLDNNCLPIAWEVINEYPDSYTHIQRTRMKLRTQSLED